MFSRLLARLGFGKKRTQPKKTAVQPDTVQPFAYRPSESLRQPEAKHPPSPPPGSPVPESPAIARPPGTLPTYRAVPTSDVRDIELVVGIDFGTSCTKIVARLPYEAGEPAYALPVLPERRAESHPHLWRSELWLAPDSTFALVPTAGASCLTDLKWTLMQWPTLTAEPSPEPSPIEAAAAFLALQMRWTRAWLAEKRPDLLISRYQLHWSWHIGFPAASLDDYARRKRYEICFAAALDLASGTVPLAFASVRDTVIRAAEAPEARLHAAASALFPEIAAAVAGFAHSPRHENGLYAMIDVGAATLDCCTFNLERQKTGFIRCLIYEADVALLGVDPARACNGDPVEIRKFRRHIDTHVRSIIVKTKQHRDPNSQRWKEGLPLFLIGGGAASETHRTCAESLDPWLRDDYLKYPHTGVRVTPLRAAELLCYQGDDAGRHRLVVAAGLSLPADGIPRPVPPSAVGVVPKPSVRDVTSSFVGNEET